MTHFCGVLGLAKNRLNYQLPESQPLVSFFGQFAEGLKVSWRPHCPKLPQ